MSNFFSFERYKQIFSLAVPVILSQGIQTLLILMDRYILSFKDSLLTAVATTSWFAAVSLSSFFIAFLSFSTAFIGKSFGRQDEISCDRILTQCFACSILFSPVILMLALWGGVYFEILQHPKEFYDLENGYFRIIMIGYIPLLFKVSIESYLIGVGKSRAILTASVVGFLCNAALCYLFVLGPLDHLFAGAEGAAVATVLSNFVSLVFLLATTSWKLQLNSFFLGFKELVNQAVYAGLEKFSTSFLFVLFVNMFVVYGSEVSSSISIVFTWDQVAFLPLIAINRSLLSLYSRYLGKGQMIYADRILHSTLYIALILMALFSVFFLCYSANLIQMFLHGKQLLFDQAQVQEMGQKLFYTTAFYVFIDACIFVYKAGLRSLGLSFWCFKYSLVIHLFLIVFSYISIYLIRVSPYQVWAYFMGMLITLAVTFFLKFYLDPSIRAMRNNH